MVNGKLFKIVGFGLLTCLIVFPFYLNSTAAHSKIWNFFFLLQNRDRGSCLIVQSNIIMIGKDSR